MPEEAKEFVIYTNEAVVTVGDSDSTITFRCNYPKYDDANNVSGKRVDKEAVVIMTTEMLRRHVEGLTQLLNTMDTARLGAVQ